ncbi:hypothetical protein VP01_2631g2, partial [Puccinia sorghi]
GERPSCGWGDVGVLGIEGGSFCRLDYDISTHNRIEGKTFLGSQNFKITKGRKFTVSFRVAWEHDIEWTIANWGMYTGVKAEDNSPVGETPGNSQRGLQDHNNKKELKPTQFQIDKKGLIDKINNFGLNSKTKPDIKAKWLCDLKTKNDISVRLIPSKEMIVDALTNPANADSLLIKWQGVLEFDAVTHLLNFKKIKLNRLDSVNSSQSLQLTLHLSSHCVCPVVLHFSSYSLLSYLDSDFFSHPSLSSLLYYFYNFLLLLVWFCPCYLVLLLCSDLLSLAYIFVVCLLFIIILVLLRSSDFSKNCLLSILLSISGFVSWLLLSFSLILMCLVSEFFYFYIHLEAVEHLPCYWCFRRIVDFSLFCKQVFFNSIFYYRIQGTNSVIPYTPTEILFYFASQHHMVFHATLAATLTHGNNSQIPGFIFPASSSLCITSIHLGIKTYLSSLKIGSWEVEKVFIEVEVLFERNFLRLNVLYHWKWVNKIYTTVWDGVHKPNHISCSSNGGWAHGHLSSLRQNASLPASCGQELGFPGIFYITLTSFSVYPIPLPEFWGRTIPTNFGCVVITSMTDKIEYWADTLATKFIVGVTVWFLKIIEFLSPAYMVADMVCEVSWSGFLGSFFMLVPEAQSRMLPIDMVVHTRYFLLQSMNYPILILIFFFMCLGIKEGIGFVLELILSLPRLTHFEFRPKMNGSDFPAEIDWYCLHKLKKRGLDLHFNQNSINQCSGLGFSRLNPCHHLGTLVPVLPPHFCALQNTSAQPLAHHVKEEKSCITISDTRLANSFSSWIFFGANSTIICSVVVVQFLDFKQLLAA